MDNLKPINGKFGVIQQSVKNILVGIV